MRHPARMGSRGALFGVGAAVVVGIAGGAVVAGRTRRAEGVPRLPRVVEAVAVGVDVRRHSLHREPVDDGSAQSPAGDPVEEAVGRLCQPGRRVDFREQRPRGHRACHGIAPPDGGTEVVREHDQQRVVDDRRCDLGRGVAEIAEDPRRAGGDVERVDPRRRRAGGPIGQRAQGERWRGDVDQHPPVGRGPEVGVVRSGGCRRHRQLLDGPVRQRQADEVRLSKLRRPVGHHRVVEQAIGGGDQFTRPADRGVTVEDGHHGRHRASGRREADQVDAAGSIDEAVEQAPEQGQPPQPDRRRRHRSWLSGDWVDREDHGSRAVPGHTVQRWPLASATSLLMATGGDGKAPCTEPSWRPGRCRRICDTPHRLA